MKLNFFLLLIYMAGSSSISLGGNEKFTKTELFQVLIQGTWDRAHVRSIIDILSNENLLSKIGGVKNPIVFYTLKKMKRNALDGAEVLDFLKNFLPIHVVDLFEVFPEKMSKFIKKNSLNFIKYFGHLENIKKIMKIFLIKFEGESEQLVEFLDAFKNDSNFSSIIGIFAKEIQEHNFSEFELSNEDFPKVASWLSLTEAKDLKAMLECLMLRYYLYYADYEHEGHFEEHAFLQAAANIQKNICLKTQQLSDVDFFQIWNEFIIHGRLCIPQAVYQLDKRKIESSGVLLAVLNLEMEKNAPNYHRKKGMLAAIVGKILPQYREKQFLKNDQEFVQNMLNTRDFLNYFDKIKNFSADYGDVFLKLVKKIPQLLDRYQCLKYFHEWIDKNPDYNIILCQNEDGAVLTFDYDALKKMFDYEKEAANFSNLLVNFIDIIFQNSIGTRIHKLLYQDLISYLPYVKTEKLSTILECLLSKDSECYFFAHSKNEQKMILSKVNELIGDEFCAMVQKVYNFSSPVCEDVLRVLKEKSLIFSGKQQIDKI
ncbi:hypothetical protein P618_200765 [Holospora obtusa F1]|uniref:Uncharacterized protein n=1 Tax=Holospora obtusa F1 TaxID=1399147 RepID=W6TDY3_HOLOB|nr:hypothetical protein [Holospora obtusa]ETZ07056.1 hypothetical protein P618_200765 [Holospora obtusa F1]